MKFILYGNDVVDYCSEVHHAKSLRALGHEVKLLNEERVTTDELLKAARTTDGLIWIHSHGFQNKGTLTMPQVLDALKEAGVPTMAYHLDLYMPLPERWQQYKDSAYMNNLDYFFTVDKKMADWLNLETNTTGYYIAPGVFHEETYLHPTYDGENFEIDVAFVGSKGYHKEWPYRPKLIEWLQKTYGDRFTHVGGDGETGVIRGDSLNKLYGRTKIVIGDTLSPGFDYPDYFSDRIFETTGRGGFIIHPAIQGLENYFTDGEHIKTYEYGNFEQLEYLIGYYLYHKDERENIRIAGHEQTKRDHTYKDRWNEILSVVYDNRKN